MATITKPKNRTTITLDYINGTQRSRLFSYMEKENIIFEAREREGIILSDVEIARLEKSKASGVSYDIDALMKKLKS